MIMAADHSGDNDLTAGINHFRARLIRNRRARADFLDDIAFNIDRAVRNI